jgi:hypothetical protein
MSVVQKLMAMIAGVKGDNSSDDDDDVCVYVLAQE